MKPGTSVIVVRLANHYTTEAVMLSLYILICAVSIDLINFPITHHMFPVSHLDGPRMKLSHSSTELALATDN